jgi:hypothetical protein
MKKILLLLLFFLIFGSSILSQTIVENPKKPNSKKAGRIVRLKEMMRIRDDGVKIVFKAPNRLQIGDDGSVYFYDDFKLYKFDQKGKFVFMVIKQGRGPGEVVASSRFLVTKKEIIVYARTPPKIMRFTLEGKYIGEKRYQVFRGLRFIGHINNIIYGFLNEIPDESLGKNGFVDYLACLYEFDPNFDKRIKKYSFPVRHYQIGTAWWPRVNFDYVAKNNETLFIYHTAEYQIIKFNLEKNIVERIIKRKYDRVKTPKRPKRKRRPGVLFQPPKEFYNDIAKLLIYKDKLWAITSTRDKQKRSLVDVYDMEGKYLDNFYLEFPREIVPRRFHYGSFVLKDGYLYVNEEHSDGYFCISKYEIVN